MFGKEERIQITLHELLHGKDFLGSVRNGHVGGPSILSNDNWTYKLAKMIYDHDNEGCERLSLFNTNIR